MNRTGNEEAAKTAEDLLRAINDRLDRNGRGAQAIDKEIAAKGIDEDLFRELTWLINGTGAVFMLRKMVDLLAGEKITEDNVEELLEEFFDSGMAATVSLAILAGHDMALGQMDKEVMG